VIRRPLAALLLSTAAAGACVPAARYPEPGEPGPVVTAAGDTIPEGPDRNAFMAGYDAGLARAQAVSASDLGFTEAAVGGLVAGFTLPWLVSGMVHLTPIAYYTAGGIGLMVISGWSGPAQPLTRLPAFVVYQGPLYQAGYREGYARGHRSILQAHRRRAAIGGTGIGIVLGVITIFDIIGG